MDQATQEQSQVQWIKQNDYLLSYTNVIDDLILNPRLIKVDSNIDKVKYFKSSKSAKIEENGITFDQSLMVEGNPSSDEISNYEIFSFPLVAIQIWKFIAPGLYNNERSAFLPFLIATPILFFAGGSMVYYLIAPVAWKFFLSYQNLNSSGIPIRLEAKMGEYLSLMMRFIFAFGLAFQLPVILGLLAKANLVTYTSLKKFRKYAIVIAFLAAAFLTPPDPFSQISLALPIILLYEISIYIAKLIQKNKKDN